VIGVELPDRLEQTLVADGDQLGEVEAVPLVLLHVRDHEAEIGGDQSLRGDLVTRQRPSREALLLLGIGDHRQLLNIEEVLVKRAGWAGPEQGAGFPSTDVGHTDPRRRLRELRRCSWAARKVRKGNGI
jgi:hypothetical protein